MVLRLLAKEKVAGPIPVSRSKEKSTAIAVLFSFEGLLKNINLIINERGKEREGFHSRETATYRRVLVCSTRTPGPGGEERSTFHQEKCARIKPLLLL